MSRVKVTLNTDGVKKGILQADFVKSYVEQTAKAHYGDVHTKSYIGLNRSHTIVYPNTERNPG